MVILAVEIKGNSWEWPVVYGESAEGATIQAGRQIVEGNTEIVNNNK